MGRVPMYPCCRDERYPGIASWEGLEHVGPISRTVADSALVLSVIAGPDPRDRHSIPAGDVDWLASGPGDLRGLRVAFSADLGRVAVDPEVARVVAEAARRVRPISAARSSGRSRVRRPGRRLRRPDRARERPARDAARSSTATGTRCRRTSST